MKRLLIIIALAGAVMVPAVANADTAEASGKLGSVGKSQAKRFVTKVAKQYQLQEADRSDYGPFTQDPTVRCKRVTRTAVDCNVEILIFDDFEECTYADSGYNSPPDFGDHTDENGCFEDEETGPVTYVESWRGEWQSWKQRVRRFGGLWAYFPKDRNASVDPFDPDFGGDAITHQEDEGTY